MLNVIPLYAKRQRGRFDLYEAIQDCLQENKAELQDGDILVLSSKYVANSQGRIIPLGRIAASSKSVDLSKKYGMTCEIAEIILRESDAVFGGVSGFVITSRDGLLAPNAGIDRSNAGEGFAVLYPNYPYQTAEQIRRKIFLNRSVRVGVILSDSRLMPARVGTIGVAIACSGIEPVDDMRSRMDLDGAPLKVTFRAIADGLASAANHSMGEGAESVPIAIVRDSGIRLTDRIIRPDEMTVPYDQCVYVRGLKSDT